MRKIPIQIESGVYFLLAVGVLLLPLRWLIAWLIAAIVHELFHYCAIVLLGGQVFAVKISAGGALMYAEDLNGWKKVIGALAGPLAGMVLCLFSSVMPRLALCGAIQSAFNLLPMGSLDGAQALYEVLISLLGRRAGARTAKWIGKIVFVLFAAGLFALFWMLKMGIVACFATVVILVTKFGKKKTLQSEVRSGTI